MRFIVHVYIFTPAKGKKIRVAVHGWTFCLMGFFVSGTCLNVLNFTTYMYAVMCSHLKLQRTVSPKVHVLSGEVLSTHIQVRSTSSLMHAQTNVIHVAMFKGRNACTCVCIESLKQAACRYSSEATFSTLKTDCGSMLKKCGWILGFSIYALYHALFQCTFVTTGHMLSYYAPSSIANLRKCI
jgi:hypothetical protein